MIIRIGTCVASAAVAMLAAGVAQAQDAAAGESVFRQCIACHSLEEGQHRVGPSLHGLFGREAGSLEDFNYSDAMRESGIVWDETTLDQFLANPQQHVPGTIMTFAGVRDETQRQNLIAYLKEATAE